MLKFINPIYLLKQLNKMRKELINLIFYFNTVNNMKSRNILKLNRLKADKINRLYTFLNLKPELLMHEKDVLIDEEKKYLGNHILKIQNVLSDHDLYELVKFRYERIQTENYYGYKIHGFFFFRNITLWWIIWYVIYIFMVIKVINWIDWDFFLLVWQKFMTLFA